MEQLKQYLKEIPKTYYTEDFSYYMYGLTKMTKPKVFVELGTGYGVTSFAVATAMKENGYGKVITLDDGSQNDHNYFNYINNKITQFELDNIQFVNKTLNGKLDDIEEFNLHEIGMVFNDINCHFDTLPVILAWLLPRKADECYLIIDRLASIPEYYEATRSFVNNLNSNKIPKRLLELSRNAILLKESVYSTRFTLSHVKKVDSKQDSFAILKMEVV